MKDAVKPDRSKVKAIMTCPSPQNVEQLQNFLGSVNFLAKFITYLSDLRVPLQQLLLKNSVFIRTMAYKERFNKIKDEATHDCLLQFYNPDKPLYIEHDASKIDIGAVLLQQYNDRMNKD